MRGIISCALSIASALLVALSFPSSDLGFLAWFGLAPLLFALRRAGPVGAAGLAFLFGLIYGGGTFYWLNSIPVITPSRFLIMLVCFSMYFLVFGFLYGLVNAAAGRFLLIGAPALWVALEYARANLFFLALPWNLLGESQYRHVPVIQIADIAGIYGISFLLVMVNQFLSQAGDLLTDRRTLQGHWRAQTAALALVLASTASYAWYSLRAPESEDRLRVAVVQANALARHKMSPPEQAKHLRAYLELTRAAARSKPDLIVWPSSSLPAPINSSIVVQFTLWQVARETGTYLLVGGAGGQKFGPRVEGRLPYSNSEFLISPSGRVEGQYNKIRLTPFDEYVPLQGKFRWPRWITTLEESYIAGDAFTLFRLPRAQFGTPICGENTFPDLFRRFVKDGAQIMVSVTNEGFYGRTAAPHQSLAMNVFRAVENRVAVARAATTGVSAFIGPKGEILDRLRDRDGKDLFVSGFLVRDLPLSHTRTFYTLHGDIFAQAVTGIAVLMVVAALVAQWRVRSEPVPAPTPS